MVLRQLTLFFIAGLAAFLTDFGAYMVLTRNVALLQSFYLLVSIFTATLGLTVSYLMNQLLAFHASGMPSLRRYKRFFFVYVLGIVWQNLLLYWFVSTQHLPDAVAKVLAILTVGLFWNFLLAKHWVFRYTNSSITQP
ncbi:MAG: GtrA family protein [Patescibacteria group bacterium]|jgi:putative flippase GtrA